MSPCTAAEIGNLHLTLHPEEVRRGPVIRFFDHLNATETTAEETRYLIISLEPLMPSPRDYVDLLQKSKVFPPEASIELEDYGKIPVTLVPSGRVEYRHAVLATVRP